jgi:predicted ATP-dependent endonuclease of OLD family
MGYIKKLKIEGYKKFRNFEIEFNEHTNIIVGANEAGKSTILEAIDLIINQRYRTAEKTVIWDMLNIENIKFFEANPTIDNLPSIAMEIDFEFDDGEKIYKDYWGANNIELEPKYGILFECKFNTESYGEALISEIESGSIPVEYYELVWSWYSLKTYNVYTKKYNAITINTDKIDANSSYNYYNKTVFKNKYEGKVIMATKNSFNNNINSAFENIKLDRLNDTQKLVLIKEKLF